MSKSPRNSANRDRDAQALEKKTRLANALRENLKRRKSANRASSDPVEDLREAGPAIDLPPPDASSKP